MKESPPSVMDHSPVKSINGTRQRWHRFASRSMYFGFCTLQKPRAKPRTPVTFGQSVAYVHLQQVASLQINNNQMTANVPVMLN